MEEVPVNPSSCFADGDDEASVLTPDKRLTTHKRGMLQRLGSRLMNENTCRPPDCWKEPVSTAVAASVLALAIRWPALPCNDGQLAGAVCSSALFIGTALLLRAAAALTLTGLHWVSLRTTTFVDSRILAVLQRDASAFAALSAFLALKVTAAIDGFQGAFIFQWLELPLLLVLSFLAVRTTNSVLTVIISRLNLSNPVATVQVVRIATAFCAAALVCDNVGIKISAIVTSLGVGGIIVALGSQTLLQDAFASAALLWDKPFVTGDVVKVAGSQSGVVETIGLKTTHVRNFDGALLVLPNRELCNRVVENYSRQPFRRHRFHLTLSPSTDPAALELLEGDLMAALGALNPDRYKVFHAWVYVTKVGERGIEVEMTYKIEGHLPKPEFKAVSSAVHIEVLKALRGRGVELAAAARLEALKGARGFSGCQDLQE